MVSAIAVAPSNPNVVYVGFDNGALWASNDATDANPNYVALNSPALGQDTWITHIAVNPTNPASIAVSLSVNNTNYTNNISSPVVFPVNPGVQTCTVTLAPNVACAAWTNITGNLTTIWQQPPVNPFPVASNSVVFFQGKLVVATDVGVYYTLAPNGNNTVWSRAGLRLPNVQVVGLTVSGSALYAATHGRGIWKLG